LLVNQFVGSAGLTTLLLETVAVTESVVFEVEELVLLVELKFVGAAVLLLEAGTVTELVFDEVEELVL
jgi:hypothetical protein